MSFADIGQTFQDLWTILKKEISEKKNSSFVKGGLGSFFIKFGDTLLRMVLGIVLARILGAETFGVYTYIFAIISVMGIPTQLGLPNLLVRYVAEYQVKEQWAKIKGLLKVSNIAVFLISALLISGSLGLLHFDIISFEETKLNTFYWGLALLPIIALAAIRAASLRGLRYIVLGLAPEKIIQHLLFIGLVLFGWWGYSSKLSAEAAMRFHFIAAFIAYMIGAYWLVLKLPDKVKNTVTTKYDLEEWVTVAIPLLLNGGMFILNNKIDVVLLGWLGTSVDVGVYEVSWRGAALVSFGLGAMNMLLGPYFSRFFHSNQHDKLQKIATVSVLLNTVLGLLIVSVFIVFGESLLGFVFGNEFTVGYTTLVILGFAHLINVMAGSVGTLLNMTGHEKKVLLGLGISNALNVVLNLLLIPKYGIEGAAAASLVTYLIWNVILVRMSVRSIGINPSITSLMRLAR